jgi:methyltransferase
MNVLLISARRSPYSGEAITAPHQGLLALAAALRAGTFADTRGVGVDVLDDQLPVIDRPLLPPSFLLQGRLADVVGVQTVTSSLKNGLKLLAEVRSRWPRALRVLGGVGPTPQARELIEDDAADVVVRGEGEISFCKLVEAWGAAGAPGLDCVPGITFRHDDGELRENPLPPQVVPLDHLPLPARDLVDMQLYRRISRGRSGNLITSRGCSFACAYCYSRHQWGVGQRRHSVERVLTEMTLLVEEYGYNRIRIEDDDFLEDRGWIEALCDGIARHDLASRMEWEAKARPDHIEPEIARRLRTAGCFRLLMGIETLDPVLLRRMSRPVKVTVLERAIDVLREAGIGVQATMILGIPGETDAAMRNTIMWLEQRLGRNSHDIVSPCFFVPFHDAVAKAMRRRFEFRLEVQDTDCFTGHVPVTSSASCSIEELQQLYDDMQPDRRGQYKRVAHLAQLAEVQKRVTVAQPQVPLAVQVH